MYDLIKKHLSRINGTLLLLSTIIGVSCNLNDLDFSDINIPNYQAGVAAPIGEVTYTVQQLIDELEDSTIVLDVSSNQFLTVIYRDTSLFNDASDFIVIDQIVNTSNINPGITSAGSPMDVLIPFTESFEYQFQPSEDEQVDSAIYNSGTARLQIQSNFDVDIDFVLKIVDFTHRDTGDTLTYSGRIPAGGSFDDPQSLEMIKTVFNRVNGENNFSIIFDGVLDVKVGQTVDAADFLTLTLTIDDPVFSVLYGFFGSTVTSIQDQSIQLDFFSDIEPQGLTFNSPEVKFLVNNSFGIPVGVLLDSISTSNSQGDVTYLTGSITDTIAVRAPDLGAIGGSLNSSISINADNSNIRDLLSISPDSITIPVRAISNYQNETGQVANFLTDSSFLETIVEISLPLEVRLDGFTRTFDFDVASISFTDADSIQLRIQTINDLPFSGTMSVDMLNDNDEIIYQVATTAILDSPVVNNIDKTEGSATNLTLIPLDTEGVNAFADASTIRLTMNVDSFQSADGVFVKIFSDYELLIKLSAIAKLNVEL